MLGCHLRRIFSGLLLLGALVLGILLAMGVLNPLSAHAAIRQLEETPRQIIYQSRQTLKDQHGNAWQAIAFKRIRPNEQASFELRLVAFPGVVEIDRSQPLRLISSLGKTLTAPDTSSNIFAESDSPIPNVGQYDLQNLLPKLETVLPLELTISILSGESISLPVPPSLIEEWKTVANY